MELSEFFAENPRAALAFSGGVDSAFLLYAGMRWGKRLKAYYVRSPFQPEFEYRDALRLARELNAELEVIPKNVLDHGEVTANPPDRCYHCKKVIFSPIAEKAREDGFSVLLDGTNASDREDDRPGMRALRELSHKAGLFTWDKPSYACLATRIPTGMPITEDLLARTEWAEAYLSALGFRDFRVRTMGSAARLQLTAQDFPRLLERRAEITAELKKRYAAVLLDLEERK